MLLLYMAGKKSHQHLFSHFPGSGNLYAGVAPESELIVVKMRNTSEDGFPRTTELMQGVDYAVRKAIEYQMPVAINISFGNTYGSHEPYN